MYIYIKTKSDPDLWTVGFYSREGKFTPVSDHSDQNEAALIVAIKLLNPSKESHN